MLLCFYSLNLFFKLQIVIQIGEEQNGMVTVRNGDNKQGSCPTQYLQEVWKIEEIEMINGGKTWSLHTKSILFPEPWFV